MLSRLSIQNYAIIDRLEIDFHSKLNIITGETGAGKSIIIGALGLILGQRAESGVLLNKDKKCVVEGCFKGSTVDESVTAFLKDHELDVNDDLLVRREIAPGGKSRAFINDTPVNLTQLNQLSSLLVDLHQQFDTLEIGESDFQREVLDALASSMDAFRKYRNIYANWQQSKRKLQELISGKEQFNKEFDYHQFQFNELEDAGLKENELELLETELKMQANAEGIKNALNKAYHILEEGEEPVIRQLKSVVSCLQPFAELQPDLPALIARIQSSYIELQDLADETGRINGHIHSDPAEMDRINERLSLGYKLLKKHGVKTTAELLHIKNDLELKLQAVMNIDEEIRQLEMETEALYQQLMDAANLLSQKRKKQVKPLETQVNKMLVQVGMPNARIKVDIREIAPSSTGIDSIDFLFDGNRSNQFQPIRKVASGGELSRLMLCIKSLVAKSMNMPTLIFDEIDTGISGEAAKQVGVIMKELAYSRQVLCITHQPQIAGKADAHYLVYKAVKENSVTTGVRLLDTDERVVAIAKMLSGEKPTAAAMENAKEMVMN